ncbi:MAG: hypothetical protein ABI304_06115 [Rudaea sp.]
MDARSRLIYQTTLSLPTHHYPLHGIFTMLKTLCICIGLGAAPLALAASPMVAHPLAPSPHATSKSELAKSELAAAKPDALRRLAPPTINVTRAVRGADGRLVLQCVQRPNPAAKVPPQRTVVPHTGGN